MARTKNPAFLAKLRLVAKAIAQMEIGVYEWPDGKPHLDRDGNYVVRKTEALRFAGYENPEKYHSADEKIFASDKYEEFLALERLRLKSVALQHVQDVHGDVAALRAASAAELQLRFRVDPGQFSTNELIKIFAVMEEFERREKSTMMTPELQSGKTTYNINTLTIGMAGKLPAGDFEEFLDQTEAQKQGELDRVREMRAAMKAKQNEEIIDGEAEEYNDGVS